MSSSGVFKNAPSTPVKETTLKKPSSAMLKTTGSEDRMSQSTAFGAKKGGLSTQADLRSSWQGSSNESNKKAVQRPLSAKKPVKEEVQLARPSTATKEDKNAGQKASLNSFVTKVNQGDMFGAKTTQASTPSTTNSGSITATSLLAKKRESSSKRVQKPMLTLDDKVTKADTKGPKTTPNVELRTFTINLGKGNNTPSSASQKNAVASSSKTKYGTSTPKEKGSIDIPGRGKTHGSQPFVYYMTGLEKAHRHAGEVDYFTQIYREHFIQSYQALSFCKMLRPSDPAIIAQKRVNVPRRESNRDRKTLVFDMDETLIHCNESADMPADVILPITFPNGEIVEAGVNIRPYAIECLKELSQHFEVIVFTASHACYANVVLDYLDPHQQYIHHRLFRDSCVVTDEGVHIKDLRVIGNRALSDMLLIDNAAYSFGFQIENGVPIIPFYDNKNDQELLHLIPYLKFLGSTKDMRDLNKQTFKFDIYHAHDSPDNVLDRLF
jgi:Dullard-like phosphatase family protein